MTKAVKKCNIILIYIYLKEIIMNALRKFFPRAFRSNDVKAFIISLVLYALIDIVCGIVMGILASIPFVGFVFEIIGALVGLYAFVGIVLSILVFVKAIK